MSFALTIPDKGRTEALIVDRKWHPMKIAGAIRHPVVPACDGFLEVQLLGRSGGAARLWLRFERYGPDGKPIPGDNGTAWHGPILLPTGLWSYVHTAHLTMRTSETYGVVYRVVAIRGTPVKVRNRVFKGGVTREAQ